MPKNQFGQSSIIKKTVFLGVFLLSFATVLVARLIDIQLLRGEVYAQLADANRFFQEELPAERGIFLDRYGQPLTRNMPNYYRLVNPSQQYSPRESISQDEALLLMASDSAQVGYELERMYRYPYSTAAVLGYVNAVTKEELLTDTTLGLSDRTGKLGLEKVYNSELSGSPGKITYEVDAFGQKKRPLSTQTGIPGKNVKTTLDPFLSEVAYRALGDQVGAVVISDAQTGHVLSIVSKPIFNASVMSSSFFDPDLERERQRQVASFFSHPKNLFFNRALGGTYPPGSVFKLVTSLAGLESGAFTGGTTVVDDGALEVGEYSYANWFYTQYGQVEGEISLQRAIARSNDIYFYKAAEWTGPDKLAEMARIFGMGQQSGIQTGGEAAGLVPTPVWKEQALGERWFLGNTYHFGIGQDNLLVTPLQINQMTQAIGNRGELCSPNLIAEEVQNCSELGFQPVHLELVLNGMIDACSSGGTAFPFFEHNQTVLDSMGEQVGNISVESRIDRGQVACKTGTAEFGGADDQGYRKTHGWFVAIVGIPEVGNGVSDIVDEAELATGAATLNRALWREHLQNTGNFPKRLAITVLVESDETQPFKEGSRDAGPIAKEIVDWIFATEQ